MTTWFVQGHVRFHIRATPESPSHLLRSAVVNHQSQVRTFPERWRHLPNHSAISIEDHGAKSNDGIERLSQFPFPEACSGQVERIGHPIPSQKSLRRFARGLSLSFSPPAPHTRNQHVYEHGEVHAGKDSKSHVFAWLHSDHQIQHLRDAAHCGVQYPGSLQGVRTGSSGSTPLATAMAR